MKKGVTAALEAGRQAVMLEEGDCKVFLSFLSTLHLSAWTTILSTASGVIVEDEAPVQDWQGA